MSDTHTLTRDELADRPPCTSCHGHGRLARLRCDDCVGTGKDLTYDEARALWLERDAEEHGS